MITVYIWFDGVGHASMKITTAAQTKYYSWWPAGAASALSPRGRADEGSSGFGHVRRNPVAYGNSKLSAIDAEGARKIQGGDHHPGGSFGYNRSDKDMEQASADCKFFFRPCSGLSAAAAEAYWQKRLNKATGKGDYHFATNNCSTTVIGALREAAVNVKVRPKIGLKTPDGVREYCVAIAKELNNNLLLHADGLPPVIMATAKNRVDRYIDPSTDHAVNFGQPLRHQAH